MNVIILYYVASCTIISYTHYTYSDDTRLTNINHDDVYTKLQAHASKWREIGGALGFSQPEMDTIQSNPMLLIESPPPPKSYLRELLNQWLEWAPRDARGSTGVATKQSLQTALLKVNLGQLAQQFLC